MTAKKMYFIGLLQNVDSSILSVKLEHNFRFKSISKEEGEQLFSVLENLPLLHTHLKLAMDYPCLNRERGKYFSVEKSFDVVMSDDGFPKGFPEFQKLELFYLIPTIRLMRLFKEGDIAMPISYYYYDGEPRLFTAGHSFAYYSRGPSYVLNEDEITKLQKFLTYTKEPFVDYIQLAFDNFELSYEIFSTNVAFLTLMNGLEALLNPGKGEIRYRISRNCGVLLGKDKQEATEIFRNVKELYNLRSSIVHGTKRKIEEGELNKLRGYLRESIKRLLKINKSKKEVLDILNESGFGELGIIDKL